ncbi:MAG: DMT family transporter [Nanoarchaeota archaeon]
MDMMQKGGLLVLLTAIISGFSIFINSFAVKGFDSSVFTFAKNVLVALLLFAVIIGFSLRKELLRLSRKQWLQLVGIGFIGGSIPFLLYFKGLQLSVGTTAGFLHKTMFLSIALFAIILLKERLTKGLFFGAVLLLAGNFLLIRPDFALSTGLILIIIATVFWALENVWAKHILKNMSGTIIGFGRMFFGSIFILMFLIFTGKAGLILSMNSSQYLWIVLTTGFLFLYVLTYYNGLKTIRVTTAACILSLGQVVTVLLDLGFRNLSLTLYDGLALLLIVLGVCSAAFYNTVQGLVQKLLTKSGLSAG